MTIEYNTLPFYMDTVYGFSAFAWPLITTVQSMRTPRIEVSISAWEYVQNIRFLHLDDFQIHCITAGQYCTFESNSSYPENAISLSYLFLLKGIGNGETLTRETKQLVNRRFDWQTQWSLLAGVTVTYWHCMNVPLPWTSDRWGRFLKENILLQC